MVERHIGNNSQVDMTEVLHASVSINYDPLTKMEFLKASAKFYYARNYRLMIYCW